ncbi:MAG TPA: TlpA disulfide reductase family protein [Polyangiaceae bacterium]|jgi:peroxiredoxin|nr:TlpA disulfide reductase family protein [Polyangiaceae bacterium]
MMVSRRRLVVKWSGTLFVLLCSGCGSLGAGASSASDEQHPLVGAAAPPFDLPAPDQKHRITLAGYSGKVVVVDFWATWCAPCHDSFPAYQRIAEKFGSQAAVIGISVDEEPAGIPKFAKETGAKFPLAWDDGQVTSKSYQPPTMPTCFVVDKSGIVRFVHSGFHAGEEREIESEIASLLK